MNKLFKYIGCILFSGIAMTACSPEEFSGANPNGLPTVEGRTISVNTDQETNTATFTVSGDFQGCYPVWYLDDAIYSILPTASYSSMSEGTHTLTVRIMNRNGQSQGSLSSSFTFNETKVDYSPYFAKLTGKTWRIDYTEKAHMGCGEPGTDGSNWWSAGVNEKADWGVYDDRISFAHSDADPVNGGSYSYDPGEGGTVYVNTGCSVFSEFNTNDGQDFMAQVSAQTSTFELIPGTFNDDECLYIKFAPHTLLPYIPNDEAYNDCYFRVEALTNTRLVLINDIGTISWRLVFTSREDTGIPDEPETPEATFDWNYDSSSNLWKSVDTGSSFIQWTTWFADNGWGTLPTQPTITHNGDAYEFDIPEGIGGSQWQGQFAIETTLTAEIAKLYNFYCLVETDNDCPGVTIKLTETNVDDTDAGKRDQNFYFADRHDVSGSKAFVYKAEGVSLAQHDAHALSLVFDFGGSPAGTHVKISKIYFEESNDVTYDSDANLWKAVDNGSAFIQWTTWFADNGWGTLPNQPTITHNGNAYEFDIPEGIGGSQWQGQFAIETTLAAAMADEYNFSCTILADNDCPGVTIKLVETNVDDTDAGKRDNNFYFDGRHDITADKAFVYKEKGKTLPKNDAHALSLVFDFGGTPAGTHIRISDIILSKN